MHKLLHRHICVPVLEGHQALRRQLWLLHLHVCVVPYHTRIIESTAFSNNIACALCHLHRAMLCLPQVAQRGEHATSSCRAYSSYSTGAAGAFEPVLERTDADEKFYQVRCMPLFAAYTAGLLISPSLQLQFTGGQAPCRHTVCLRCNETLARSTGPHPQRWLAIARGPAPGAAACAGDSGVASGDSWLGASCSARLGRAAEAARRVRARQPVRGQLVPVCHDVVPARKHQ